MMVPVLRVLANVASYILTMASTGVRELKDNLSRYIRRIEAGSASPSPRTVRSSQNLFGLERPTRAAVRVVSTSLSRRA